MQATCHESQTAEPRAALDRLMASGFGQLAPEIGAKYTSGLDEALRGLGPAFERLLPERPERVLAEPERVERACLRLLDALLLDYGILVVVDDAQWLDGDSARIVGRMQIGREATRLHILVAERERQSSPIADLRRNSQHVLAALSDLDSASLVRAIYPAATDRVTREILAYGQGIPVNLISIAGQAAQTAEVEKEGIERSASAVIQREVRSLPVEQSELLQACAVMKQPIEYRIVRALCRSDLEAATTLSGLMPRYLEAYEGSFRFVHDVVARAVEQTIALPAVVHRKILTGLLTIQEDPPGIARRIADHAAGCGDREMERKYAVKLARGALATSAWDVAADAFHRALQLREPTPEEYVQFYTEYGQALRALLRLAECHALLERAIVRGRQLGLTRGFGILAVSLIATAIPSGDYDLAEGAYRDIRPLLATEDERLDLDAVMATVYAFQCRAAEYGEIRARLEERRDGLSDLALTFASVSDAIHLGRSGYQARAFRMFRLAKLRADAGRSFQGAAIESQMIAYAAFAEGCQSAEAGLRAFAARYGESGKRMIASTVVVVDFMRGAWDDALGAVAEAKEWGTEATAAADLLAVELAIAALGDDRKCDITAARAMMDADMRQDRWAPGVLLATWILAVQGQAGGIDVDAIRAKIASAPGGVLPWSLPFGASVYLGLALYAERARDKSVLSWLCDCNVPADNSAWCLANFHFARAISRKSLGLRDARDSFDSAEQLYRSLGAEVLATMVARRAEQAIESSAVLLRELGAARKNSGKVARTKRGRTSSDDLSKRELEIAELVASGSTNKQIASALFLSERTVEAHLASVFRKTDVASRAQLTRWYLLR